MFSNLTRGKNGDIKLRGDMALLLVFFVPKKKFCNIYRIFKIYYFLHLFVYYFIKDTNMKVVIGFIQSNNYLGGGTTLIISAAIPYATTAPPAGREAIFDLGSEQEV